MTTIKTVTASFTRPNDTNAYAFGDLVANSTTAGSVLPMTFSLSDNGRGGLIRRARIRKSGTSVSNASFRIHLYRTQSVTAANGDNSAWSTDQVANYLGSIDVTADRAFTDGAQGVGVPTNGAEINFQSNMIYALIEARAAYTPSALEVFTVEVEAMFD
ncbi:MAG: hypothetical protein E6R03_11485 [Hyphomicrobiaceae bacterium]|nr:MAG: hypothetical protein E6R03_11485 [Hyphomicrobiaceae bacterium]